MEDSKRTEIAAGLVRMVALYDAPTATHLRATAVLVRRIAVQMRVARSTAAAAELGGLLHDIGKVAVGRDILCKPAELSASEWDEMRRHAGQGAAVLEELPLLADLAPLVRAHHERMDGFGYPDRLSGDEIPLESRIVAVADAFHALTTDRPYRRAMLPNVALQVLQNAAGTQFDPDVVGATLELFHHPRITRTLSA